MGRTQQVDPPWRHRNAACSTRASRLYDRTPSAAVQPPDRLAGADHIDAIQEFLLLDRILLPGPRRVTITNRQAEMFCHLVLVDNLAGPHADLGGRLRARPAGRTRSRTALPSSASVAASGSSWRLGSPLLGQLGVVASDQPFSRELRRGDLPASRSASRSVRIRWPSANGRRIATACTLAEIQPKPGYFLSTSIWV